MMDALEQARREIDTVDAQLAALFERRMKAVLSVAEYKKAHGLPIFDAAREKVVLDKAEARIGDPALRPYYRDHVQNMMDVAKQYEAEVLGRNRAAEAVEKASSGAVYCSRPIDIAIIFYDDEVIGDERLTVPHPLLAEREFALVPLCEIMRQRRHPVTGATVGEMLDALRNK